jgi:hypothetical protein
MSEPRQDAVLMFLANALVGIGWLILGLGGLCTLGLGIMGDRRLVDWLMPLTILAVGGGLMWAGGRLRTTLDRKAKRGADG